MSNALEVNELSIHYGGFQALRSVSFRIEPRSVAALVGPSGCGKTSLLRAIAGFETPSAGSITIGGEVVSDPGRWIAPEKRRVGMVFQQGALFPHLTALRNVLYGLKGFADAEERAHRALELVAMGPRRGHFPNQLSGGEQQRVALARALAPEPRLILLDEPFASLDASLRHRLRGEVRAILDQAGATGLLVTHDQEEALSTAENVAVMMDGRILQSGPPEEIYLRPASLEVADFFGGGQLFDCRIEDGIAQTVFGQIPCSGLEGEGQLLVRPEDFALSSDPVNGSGVFLQGRVRRRDFLGHDLVDEVLLEDGRTIRIRVLATDRFQVGEIVRVGLRPKTFHAFPGRSQGRNRTTSDQR